MNRLTALFGITIVVCLVLSMTEANLFEDEGDDAMTDEANYMGRAMFQNDGSSSESNSDEQNGHSNSNSNSNSDEDD